MLCFGARDEDGGRDFQGEAVELLLAGDVLDGLVVQTAADAVFVRGALTGAEFVIGVGDEGDARDLQDVEEEQFGVAGGCSAEMLVAGELCGGNGESLAKSHGIYRVSRYRVSRMRMLPSGSVMVRLAPFFTAATPSLWRWRAALPRLSELRARRAWVPKVAGTISTSWPDSPGMCRYIWS